MAYIRRTMAIPLVFVIAFILAIWGNNPLYGQNLTSLFYSTSDLHDDMSFSDLMQKYWDWWINIPNAPGAPPGTSPFPITECDIKDLGKVVFLVDALKVGHDTNYSCHLDEGKSLFFPLLTSEYDRGLEGYENATIQQLEDAAKQENTGDSATLRIDNKSIDPVFLNNLNTISLPWNITTNQTGNHYDAPVGNFTGVVYGNFAYLKPLDRGPHEIQIKASQTDKTPENPEVLQSSDVTITYKIIVD